MVTEQRSGCHVGALICDVSDLSRVFEAVRVTGLARPKAVKPHGEQKAFHLTVEGATLLSTNRAPNEIQQLLDEGIVEFIPGLRVGAQLYRGPGPATDACTQQSPTNELFRFIELFAGIGGFHYAFAPLGGKCVFASEIDVDCQETYALNFGSDHLYGDITAIPSEIFPAHDILTAGFPCQPFARRGDRLGFEDCRGELFYEIPRVLRACKPSGFLLENVWNVQYIGDGCWDKDEEQCSYGEVFKEIIRCLETEGYIVHSRTLSAQNWVPQRRERIYFVGFRSDLATEALQRFEWPQPPGGGVIADVLELPSSQEAQSCELSDAQWQAVQKSSTWRSGGERLRFADLTGVAATLTASYRSSYATTAQLVSSSDSGLQRPRFYTRRECARLMGFPEEHRFGNANSPNRAYHQLGNAVCPPVVRSIAENMLAALGIA